MLTGFGLAAGLIALMFAAALVVNGGGLPRPVGSGDFYAVVPHDFTIALFGGVFLFAGVAIGIGARRFWQGIEGAAKPTRDVKALVRAFRDVLTLRHLHASGADCTTAEETRTPWRRWLHHCTFYGFLSCFASTSVAAVYHTVFGWLAPYGYTSVPVVLGTARRCRARRGHRPAFCSRDAGVTERSADPAQDGMDQSFIALLFLTAFTGLLLLVLRERAVMSTLLIVHLGVVLALFLTLPYGKFVHGIYRTAALVKHAKESVGD